jgi:hypothetical protein
METTAVEEVNKYSPQIGQSLSMASGWHLCEVARAMVIHTLHLCICVSTSLPSARGRSYLAMVEVFSQALASSADTAIRAMIDLLLAVVVP